MEFTHEWKHPRLDKKKDEKPKRKLNIQLPYIFRINMYSILRQDSQSAELA